MKTRLDEIQEEVNKYDAKYPTVWERFVELTFDRINVGFKHYSVKAIIERIRWDMHDIGANGFIEFKISNNIAPFYARKFMKTYPNHDGFFRTRIQTSTFERATGSNAKPDLSSENFKNLLLKVNG